MTWCLICFRFRGEPVFFKEDLIMFKGCSNLSSVVLLGATAGSALLGFADTANASAAAYTGDGIFRYGQGGSSSYIYYYLVNNESNVCPSGYRISKDNNAPIAARVYGDIQGGGFEHVYNPICQNKETGKFYQNTSKVGRLSYDSQGNPNHNLREAPLSAVNGLMNWYGGENVVIDDKGNQTQTTTIIQKLEVTEKATIKELEVTEKTTTKELEVTEKAKIKELEVTEKATTKELEVTEKAKIKELEVTDKAAIKELKVSDNLTVGEKIIFKNAEGETLNVKNILKVDGEIQISDINKNIRIGENNITGEGSKDNLQLGRNNTIGENSNKNHQIGSDNNIGKNSNFNNQTGYKNEIGNNSDNNVQNGNENKIGDNSNGNGQFGNKNEIGNNSNDNNQKGNNNVIGSESNRNTQDGYMNKIGDKSNDNSQQGNFNTIGNEGNRNNQVGHSNLMGERNNDNSQFGNDNRFGNDVTDTVAVGNRNEVLPDVKKGILVGTDNRVEGDRGIAIGADRDGDGVGAVAKQDGIAIGSDTKAALDGVAIGADAKSVESKDVAIGAGAVAEGRYNKPAVALGADSLAKGAGAVAEGAKAKATADYAKANGYMAEATVTGATAIGAESTAGGRNSDGSLRQDAYDRIVGQGYNKSFQEFTALADQINPTTLGRNALAIGHGALANGGKSEAVGSQATALGDSARAYNDRSTAVGATAKATGEKATAVGYGALASGEKSTAEGAEAEATGQEAKANGYSAKALGNYSTAIGSRSNVSSDYGTALGYGATVSETNGTAIGSPFISTDNAGTVTRINTEAIGKRGVAIGNGSKAGEDAIALGTLAGAENGSVAIGAGTAALGKDSTAVGKGSISAGNRAKTDGFGNQAWGDDSSALGSLNRVGADPAEFPDLFPANEFPVNGSNPKDPRRPENTARSTAVGYGNRVFSKDAGAFGSQNYIAPGADRSYAIGVNAVVTAPDSVSLGSGSIANEPMTVSVGAPGRERRITNVADGINDFDAVNVRQLRALDQKLDKGIGDLREDMNQLKSDAFGGIAQVAAMGSAPVPEGATVGVGVGFATFGGKSAGAMGATWRPAPFMSVNTGIGVSGNNAPMLFRIGMGFAF